MADAPILKTSYSSGELSPQVWGRTDMRQFHNGCSVMRNAFVNYRGGSSSRAGTAWVGKCKQPASSAPPRNIPFRFSSNQSYVLEFGDQYMRVVAEGGYVTEAPVALTGVTLSYPAVVKAAPGTWVVGDWIYIDGIVGTTQLNGRTFIISAVAGGNYTLHDIFDRPVNALGYTAYSSGGTGARIYTKVSPYAAVDLPYLKFTQSADVMTLCCVNQETGAEYPPYDLSRNSPTNWVFTQTTYGSSVQPPGGVTIATTSAGAWWYQYVITTVDSVTGDESIASAIATVQSVNIATTAGTITLGWNPVAGAQQYNIYRAPVSSAATVPLGGLFGYVGTTFGTQFADGNITPSYSKTPPLHLNPFARGQIEAVTPTAGGSGYTQATTTVTINTSTGAGAVVVPVVVSGAVVAFIIENAGANYANGDTITINSSGGGTLATATLTIGPQTGTYPGVAAYFQQRRIYAYTLNKPDTYFASKTSSYTNMDQTAVPLDTDAIVGNPWAQQVNGVQWLIPMPGGLIIGTGDDVWQLAGQGGADLSPGSQQATPQETYGFSKTVPPLKIGYNILYCQPYGSAVREMQYNYYAQIYLGTDVSFLSNHLFEGHQIVQWGWSREPYKIVWAVREDGKFLSLSYLKEQEINGWARHDTNGLVKSVCVIQEPPVDVPYFIVKRYIAGVGQWAYYQERMDDRLWENNEDVWAIDAGRSLNQPTRAATITMSSATGLRSLTNASVVAGGTGYTAPTVSIVDPTGSGSGAEVVLTAVAGVITGAVVTKPGQNYQAYSALIQDATGRGGVIALVIDTSVVISADAPVFTAADVGAVVRVDGGQAVVDAYQTPTLLTATLTQAPIETIPNDPYQMPVPAAPGAWSITHPVTTLTNLEHLEGMTVSILADGSVQPPQIVVDGTIVLPSPASDVKIGLPFIVQIQSMHSDLGAGAPTIQAKRKHISSVLVRVSGSRGFTVGANQAVASTQPMGQEIPWGQRPYGQMMAPKERGPSTTPGVAIPLYSGDYYINIDDDWNTPDFQASPGMVAVQQTDPLPINLLMTVAEENIGDK